MENIVSRLIQIGVVTAIDIKKLSVRVKFPDTGITSDWLRVLQHPYLKVLVTQAGKHSHNTTTAATAKIQGEEDKDVNLDVSVGIKESGEHNHSVQILTWLPKVNDTVVVLYLPVFNSDGFVIGGL